MMQTVVSRRYRFCASHRLHSNGLSAGENSAMYGKCNNPFGHGHDYVLDVSVAGDVDGRTGLVIRPADLDRFVTAEVLHEFAYKNLNEDIAEFARLVPTTENLAIVMAKRLTDKWSEYFPYSSARVKGISIQETERNSFEIVLTKMDESVFADA